MKNQTNIISISNNGTSIKFELSTSKAKEQKHIEKALVYRFFDYYDTLRSCGAKAFKANQPFVISMEINGVQLWDSSLNVHAQTTLKLINTPKGRGMFEMRLSAIIAWCNRQQVNSAEEIVKSAIAEGFVVVK